MSPLSLPPCPHVPPTPKPWRCEHISLKLLECMSPLSLSPCPHVPLTPKPQTLNVWTYKSETSWTQVPIVPVPMPYVPPNPQTLKVYVYVCMYMWRCSSRKWQSFRGVSDSWESQVIERRKWQISRVVSDWSAIWPCVTDLWWLRTVTQIFAYLNLL